MRNKSNGRTNGPMNMGAGSGKYL